MTKKDKVIRKISFDIITNFFLIVILTWKLLPVILAPGDIIANPISILYASGGVVGISLGTGFGVVYLGLKIFLYGKNKIEIVRTVIIFFAVAGIISLSLFFVSGVVRNGDGGVSREGERSVARTVDNMAPDFELMDIEGKIISLRDYRGKWVVLNFWATWCPPCKAELPTLNRFYEGMDKDKVVLLGINATGTEKANRSDLRSYVATFVIDEGIDFPVLLDFCDGTQPCVSTVYGAGNLPTTVVISPEGVITKVKTGVVDSFWLRSVVAGD
ncbi:MAG: redoxin domain-containing protein [Spirochaetia bacterium]|nr:redoxin domain-containing protein [Spirochaetia bacterium]